MAENRFDPNDLNFVAEFIKKIGSVPPNREAYEALMESIRLEKGIKTFKIDEIDGMPGSEFKVIRNGLIANLEDLDHDEAYGESIGLLDDYVCKKYNISEDDFDKAQDWQLEQMEAHHKTHGNN